MSIELQNIDCNCNNCIFMQRDTPLYNHWLAKHQQWALDYFNTLKNKMLAKATEWDKKGDAKKAAQCRKQAANMRFQFDKKEVTIQYGMCTHFNKPVSFIPNTCQLHTQQCFVNRKQI